MGRHSMPTRSRRGPARHAARRTGRAPTARAPIARAAASASMAAALLVAVPVGHAAAEEPDDAPPALLDGAGTALGSALGTDDNEEPDPDTEPDAGIGSGTAGADDLLDMAEPPGTDSGATHVELLEKNGSGVSGDAEVDAERVVAAASGMDPEARYVSFFYGATSSATNNNPCILDGTNPLPGNQTVGEWEVDEDGEGTLRAANPLGARYGLQAGTMSIRKVEHDLSTATALPVNPASYSLVACGEVQRLEVLDPVTDAVPSLPKLPSVPPLS